MAGTGGVSGVSLTLAQRGERGGLAMGKVRIRHDWDRFDMVDLVRLCCYKRVQEVYVVQMQELTNCDTE